ncbi:hypothetical protein ACWEKM_18545 [Streptomyces sp. NPDC004752]
MTVKTLPGLAASTWAILARSSPGRALPPGPGAGPAGVVGEFGAAEAGCCPAGPEGGEAGAGVAVFVIEKVLSPGNRAHFTRYPFSGGPHWRVFHSRPFRELFKYSSTRAPPEAVFRLDNAGILVNSRPFFRAFSIGATQGVVPGDLHDRFPGTPTAPEFRKIECTHE